MKTLLPIAVCIVGFSLFLYSYLEEQNSLTKLRFAIPEISKEIKALKEENTRMRYEIDQFENPEHLIELARHSEFSHLRHPLVKEIATMQEGIALTLPVQESAKSSSMKPKVTLAVGAK